MFSVMQQVPNRTCRAVVCAALGLAAVGDAGPEIVSSGSLFTGYDGPGPLIYLAFAVFVGVAPWRYAPLAAVVMSAFFIIGGFADPVFSDRLTSPSELVDFGFGWLQLLAFAVVIVFGLAAVWWKPRAIAPQAGGTR